MLSLVSFDGERFKDGELLEDNSPSVGVSTSSGTTGPFPLSWVINCASRSVLAIHFQDHNFFQSRLAAGHSRVVSARPGLATLSSVLLIPLSFSLCPDANGGISLLTIGSS